MQFALPDTAIQLEDTIKRWVDAEVPRQGVIEPYRSDLWQSFLKWDLLLPDFGDYLHRTVGLMETSTAGLLGPVLEAYLAIVADDSGTAEAALRRGDVVTSARLDRAEPVLTGWGAVANLVVDQQTGQVLRDAPLPPAEFAYPVPHGWLVHDDFRPDDPHVAEKWYLATTLASGLITGALALTTAHVKERHQFGKPLAAFQAVQFPLAELKVWADGVRLLALDTAIKRDAGDERWTLAAALGWLSTVRAAEKATKTCHQSFGASGFCNETGLVQLTSSLTWLRLTVGTAAAQQFVLDSRAAHLRRGTTQGPGCLILEGSAVS
jgi:hypothetical protein